jgi:hypothetical protein
MSIGDALPAASGSSGPIYPVFSSWVKFPQLSTRPYGKVPHLLNAFSYLNSLRIQTYVGFEGSKLYLYSL